MGPEIIIPTLGIFTGMIIPLAAFIWLYLENKDKNKTILEISKNIDDPSKLEELVSLLDERKKILLITEEVLLHFVGIGLFLFGVLFLGAILKGVEKWGQLVLVKLLLDICIQTPVKRLQMLCVPLKKNS